MAAKKWKNLDQNTNPFLFFSLLYCWRATLSQWMIIGLRSFVRVNHLQEACSKEVTMATYVIKVTVSKYDL